MQTLDVDAIEQWLQADSDAEVKFASDPNILIDWIVNKQWSDTQSLCTSLWQQVTFPPAMQRSLNQI
jgi:hypothetical protein